MRYVLFLCIAFATLMMAGCGGVSPAMASKSAKCKSLMSFEAVQQIMGEPAKVDRRQMGNLKQINATWKDENGASVEMMFQNNQLCEVISDGKKTPLQ